MDLSEKDIILIWNTFLLVCPDDNFKLFTAYIQLNEGIYIVGPQRLRKLNEVFVGWVWANFKESKTH